MWRRLAFLNVTPLPPGIEIPGYRRPSRSGLPWKPRQGATVGSPGFQSRAAEAADAPGKDGARLSELYWGLSPDRRLHVDRALGELGQLLVGLPFLVESLLEELRLILLAEDLGVGAHRAVAGHLVVLHPLGGRDQGGVHHLGVHVLLHHLLALFEQSFHALALLAAGGLADLLEDPIQALDVRLGHLQMLLERCLELLVARLLDHLRQGLQDLLLRAVQVLQLVHVELPEGIHLHVVLLFSTQASLPSGLNTAKGVPNPHPETSPLSPLPDGGRAMGEGTGVRFRGGGKPSGRGDEGPGRAPPPRRSQTYEREETLQNLQNFLLAAVVE